MPLIYCPECGNQTSDQAEACNKCGYPIAKLNFNQKQSSTNNTNTVRSIGTFADLDYYYQQEFEEIQKSNEAYKGKWNWYAFLFTWIWCLTKGLWGYAVIWFVILGGTMLTRRPSELTIIVVSLVYAIVLGWRGTWIFYNYKTKGKQFPN